MAESTPLSLRSGTTDEHKSVTGEPAEITVDTTKNTAVVHDGTTQGGHPLLRENAPSGLPTIRPSLNLDFANTKSLDPRIDFTRATTATYYDGETFAKAEENFVEFSQDLENKNASISPDVDLAPDNTSTADKFIPSTTYTHHVISESFPKTETVYTVSVFAKPAGYNILRFLNKTTKGAPRSGQYDLVNGTVNTDGAGHFIDQQIIDVGNGWFRCIFTCKSHHTYRNIKIETMPDGATPSTYGTEFAGDGTSGILLWGWQIEERSQVTAYTPTTDQPITNYIPVLKTAAPNEPRFDHDPVTGESKGLLIEEQRTNEIRYSEDFSHSNWENARVSVSVNEIVAPDGTLTMDKLVENTSSDSHRVRSENISLTQNTTYTLSIFAKKGERNFVAISHTNFANWSGTPIAYFNLDTGEIVSTGSGTTAKIEDVGNGVYRCSLTATFTAASTTGQVDAYVSATGSLVYTGDGYSGIYIWGAQLEEGSFPTSYIKTEGSQVTRVADSASITGENFSEWYRQDEGTVFVEATDGKDVTGGYDRLIQIRSDGDNSNRIGIYGGYPRLRVEANGDLQFNSDNVSNGTVTDFSVSNRFSFRIKRNDLAYAINGELVDQDSSIILPQVDQIGIGQWPESSARVNACIKRLTYYPKRLPNAVLQTLTEE